MTPLPCPSCGFDCREDRERMRRIAVIRSSNSMKFFRVVAMECASCGGFWAVDNGLSAEGVGAERLVPTEITP